MTMFISKESILKAYEFLSKATPVILNNFSAIQYFLATDRYFKENNEMPCDSSDTASKSKFYSYVEDVISLDDHRYLSSFKTIYEGPKSISSTVSSNFFSGSSVEHSNNTSGKRFDYPKKGPLLYAMDGKVFKETSYYSNLSDYLPSDKEKFALAVWLLRKESRFSDYTLSEFKEYLGTTYSEDVVNTLIPTSLLDINDFSFTGVSEVAYIGVSDILPRRKIATVDYKKMEKYLSYLTAIRTKPFLLLAGISGTGKSRIVRELAFKSCPKYLQDKDGTTPGNYCMIEVKPNWHDSTELLGYYSRLGQAGYQFKKFVMFLVKAKMFPKVPFFVCLDEMNLAPVEHYFAEILSILETRKHPKITGTDEHDMKTIKTDPIVEARYFRELGQLSNSKNIQTGQAYSSSLSDRDIYMKLFGIDTEHDIEQEIGQRTDLTTEGLTLPDNVIIIGTVNMDDTTHQFSRKVIDRAMTIEMNGGKLSDMYGGSKDLEYISDEEQEKWQQAFHQRYVTADEVLKVHSEQATDIMEKVPARLEEINKALKGTPFEVSYRVLNELTIMIGVMLDEQTGEDIDSIINKAVYRILLMKILPRIEGDADMFRLKETVSVGEKTCHNRLEWLKELAPLIENAEGEEHQQTARDKIQEMIERLENQEFTRFWP